MLDIKNVYILAETFKSPIQKHPCSPLAQRIIYLRSALTRVKQQQLVSALPAGAGCRGRWLACCQLHFIHISKFI